MDPELEMLRERMLLALGIGCGIFLLFGLANWMFGSPRVPERSLAYGCFTADGAPPVKISSVGLTLGGDRTVVRSSFALENGKNGIWLMPGGSFELVADNGRYFWRAAAAERTRMWRFDKNIYTIGTNPSGPENLSGFGVSAADRKRFSYRRSPAFECGGLGTG